jgi:hypothetical protein
MNMGNRSKPHTGAFCLRGIGSLLIMAAYLLSTGMVRAQEGGSLTGPKGEAGEAFQRPMSIGAGGAVHELDAFLYVPGTDLNGDLPGATARLSRDSLPADLLLTVNGAWTVEDATLGVVYTLTNTGDSTYRGLRFLSFFDGEIDQEANTFFNETARFDGMLGAGPEDFAPDSWMIDEPGYGDGGAIIDGLNAGMLGNSNSFSGERLDDVSMALGFDLGDLPPEASSSVSIMISSAGDRRGPVALIQREVDGSTEIVLTFSGESTLGTSSEVFGDVTPFITFDIRWRLNYRTGLLMGTLVLTNPESSGKSLSKQLQLAFKATPDKRFWVPDGVTQNGSDYVDLTAQFLAALAGAGNGDEVLNPGESVSLGEFEFYSLRRDPPAKSLFRVWSVSTP